MTGPDDPQYPDPQYPTQHPQPYPAEYPPPGGPPYPAPPGDRARGGIAAGLAERAARRPQPRLGVSLAGAGIGLIIFGILVWGGDYASSGEGGASGGNSHRFLGVVLALLVVLAGYTLAIRAGRGPLATAGVVSGALGVPVLLGFLTLGENSDGFPFSFDAIAIVSIIVWVISYLAIPGARGHAFLLAASGVLFWIYLLDKVEPKVFSLAFFFPQLNILGGSEPIAPDFSSVAALSIVLGLGYYLTAFLLDRSGRHGMATAFVVAALPALDVGVSLAAPDLDQIGTGVLVIVLGLIIGSYAARYERRFTTWTSVTGAAFGAVLIIVKLAGDNATAGGIALIVVGAVVALGGAAVASLLGEPDDMAPRRPPTAAQL